MRQNMVTWKSSSDEGGGTRGPARTHPADAGATRLVGLLLCVSSMCGVRPTAAQATASGYLVIGRPAGVSMPCAPGDTRWQVALERVPAPVRAAHDGLRLPGVDDACTTVFTDTRHFLFLRHSSCSAESPSEDNEAGVVFRADGGQVGPGHALLPLHFYTDIHAGQR